MSTLFSNFISVGASGSIMGIIAAYLAFLLINWNSLEIIGNLRYYKFY